MCQSIINCSAVTFSPDSNDGQICNLSTNNDGPYFLEASTTATTYIRGEGEIIYDKFYIESTMVLVKVK